MQAEFGDGPFDVDPDTGEAELREGSTLELPYRAAYATEFDTLRRSTAEIVQEFVENMDELAAAAEREGNPIVFI